MTDFPLKLWVFLLSSLAIWRISSLFAREDGPLDIFEHIRTKLAELSSDKNFGSFRVVIESLYRGVMCMWCNSVWFSAIWSVFISTSFPDWILNTLSLSTMVIAIEVLIKGRTHNG